MSRKLRLTLLCAVLFVLGIARLGPRYDEHGRFPENNETIRLARSLAFRGQFANPFRLAETGPSAYLSPGCPALLGLVVRLFGTGAEGYYVFQFSAAAAMAAQLALLPVLSETLGIGWCPGILACVIGLIPPLLTFPDWEPSYAGLLIVLATIFWWKFLREPKSSGRSAALFGVIAGILLLTSASAFSVLAVWFAHWLWRSRLSIFRNGGWAALLIPVVMLTPWTVRNYAAFHRFIPFRTAFGLALAVSDNDCAPVGVRQSERNGCLMRESPNHNVEEAQRARALGEAQYNTEKLHEAMRWITTNPRRFASLTLQRVFAFWFPFETSPWRDLTALGRRRERVTIYVMTILSFLGMALLMKFNRAAFSVLASWLVVFPLIYYVVLFEDRYRYPILWATLVSGAYPLCLAARSASVFGRAAKR
jgi:hypothetical protein